jgi:L-lactate dehydrogenase complex protein LldG
MSLSSAREEIIRDVKRALGRGAKTDPDPDPATPSASTKLAELASQIRQSCEQRRGALVEQFESELSRIGVPFNRAANPESAFQYIEQVRLARDSRTIVAWETQAIADIGLGVKLKEKGVEFLTESIGPGFIRTTETADIGVSGVDYVLADTGTLVLLTRRGQARTISLLPPVHIAIVRPQQILSGLSDLFPLIRFESLSIGTDLSSAITFITGPSRTADIELTLVVGVHGPQQLHVLLLD